jgi:hypothetical protein
MIKKISFLVQQQKIIQTNKTQQEYLYHLFEIFVFLEIESPRSLLKSGLALLP